MTEALTRMLQEEQALTLIAGNNGSITEDLTNISGGTYILTVTDDKGCIYKVVTITEPPSPIFKLLHK